MQKGLLREPHLLLSKHYTKMSPFNSLLMVIGKFSIKMGNLLHMFGSCECHSKPTKEMYMPLRQTPKTLFVVVNVNLATNRNWQTKLLDAKKVTHLNLLQEGVKTDTWCYNVQSGKQLLSL